MPTFRQNDNFRIIQKDMELQGKSESSGVFCRQAADAMQAFIKKEIENAVNI